MDKYEFNLKVDQIRKMVNKGDYGTAKRIAVGSGIKSAVMPICCP